MGVPCCCLVAIHWPEGAEQPCHAEHPCHAEQPCHEEHPCHQAEAWAGPQAQEQEAGQDVQVAEPLEHPQEEEAEPKGKDESDEGNHNPKSNTPLDVN